MRNYRFRRIVLIGLIILAAGWVNAQAPTGSGESNTFRIDNRTGEGFRVTSVGSSYTGVFAEGVSLSNTFTAGIDWWGQLPSYVVFTLNGQAKTIPASGDTAQTSFNMGSDLSYSAIGAKNELRVQAFSQSGIGSAIHTSNFWGFTLPQWAQAGPLKAVLGTGKVNYKGSLSMPGAAIDAKADIPDTLPQLGGLWGIKTSPFEFSWDLYAYPMGTTLGADFDVQGKWGGELTGGKNAKGSITATVGGSGGFSPKLGIHSVNAGLRAEAGFSTPAKYLPKCPVDPCPYFMASVALGLEGTVLFVEGTPELFAGLKFAQSTLGIDATVSGTIGSKAGWLWKAEGTIGGRPSITFQFPSNEYDYCLNRYIQSIQFKVLVEAYGRVLWWEKPWSEEYVVYRCPQTSKMEILSLDTGNYSGVQVMNRDYLKADEGYCVFAVIDPAAIRIMSVGGMLEPIYNVGTMSSPSVAASADSGLLVFVYDDASKPTGKHQEIYFARWVGSQWTAHAPITVNNKPDIEPVAAIDSNGAEIAVWMQAPEITGTEQGPRDIIGGFEIVWSKYDSVSGSWISPAALTDNNYADALPWFDRSVEGELRVCWVASPTNAIAVWDDEAISPLVNLMAADWNGDSFGQPYMIAGNLVTASKPAVCRTDSHEIIAYLKDHDNNSATMEDSQVVVRTRQLGGQWADDYYLTNDNVAKLSVDIATDDLGMPIVAWTDRSVSQILPDGNEQTSDQVWFSAFTEDIWTYPELAIEYSNISEPTLYRNQAGKIVLYWTALSEDFWDMYYSVLDTDYMRWSDAQQITFDQDAERMISVTESEGNILVGYVKQRIDMSDPNLPPQIGLSDIHLLEHIPTRDLSIDSENIRFSSSVIEDVFAFANYWLDDSCQEPDWCGGFDFDQSGDINWKDFSPFSEVYRNDYDYYPGKYTIISADVYLAGDFTTHDVRVDFYEGDPDNNGTLIDSQTIDIIFPGSKQTPQVLWRAPLNTAGNAIYVVVDPDNEIQEDNIYNNIAVAAAFKPELQAKVIQVLGCPNPEQIIIGVDIENIGTGAAEDVAYELRKDSSDGVIIHSGQIERIESGEKSGSQFVWDVSEEDAGFKTLVLIIDPDGEIEEANKDNNTLVSEVAVFADLLVEQWSAEIDGTAATVLVRNAGAKASEPAVVQVIGKDIVMGQTQIEAINPGDSIEVEILLSDTLKSRRATFSVNPDMTQEEMFFSNNSFDKLLVVSADLDGSEIVDSLDLLIMADNWLSEGQWLIADINEDGIVDLQDFIILAEVW